MELLDRRALSGDGALRDKGQNNCNLQLLDISLQFLCFSWQWREWCRENRECEATVAAHNEPMQRQLSAGAADPSGRSLQDGV